MDSHGQAAGATSSTDGFLIAPLAAAAALDGAVFSRVNATEAIPATWEERARKAWEFYLEEPLVKNCVNSWRSFAVGDEIKISCDDEDVKWEAIAAAERLAASDFVKDMVLQLLVKGDAVGFKRYSKDRRDIEELICVNPVGYRGQDTLPNAHGPSTPTIPTRLTRIHHQSIRRGHRRQPISPPR